MGKSYKKFIPDGGTAVNLGKVLCKCIAVANELYKTDIHLTANTVDNVEVASDAENTISRIVQILEIICQTNSEAELTVEVDTKLKKAVVMFKCEGICNGMTLEFDLYTGIPSNVISDKDTEAALEALIRETFKKAAKIRKSRESL